MTASSSSTRRLPNDDETTTASSILSQVQDYYGKVLSKSDDLKTNACCSPGALPGHQRAVLDLIDEEITGRFYGCGSPIPEALAGCTVLDLGCGSGRDAYMVSRLVGDGGKVIGVDMTEEQLEVANRHRESQSKALGLERPNVEFRQGYIEDLSAAGVEDESVDVVISNCVINLSPDKPRVLAEIFRVLRPGGELHFSDVFADRRIPEQLRRDETLYGECLAGALYVDDFRRELARVGCSDHRVVASRPLSVDDPLLRARCAGIAFSSITVRAFKLDDLEDRQEDYGQVAVYRGTIEECPDFFDLDGEHRLVAQQRCRVSGNTAAMLSWTRLSPHFVVEGDRHRHLGRFARAPAMPDGPSGAGGGCC